MPIDTRSAFADLMNRADGLLAKTASRTAKVAAPRTVETELSDLDARVAETSVEAQVALSKLAAERAAKIARRADKVKIAQHIAVLGARLLEA